MLKGLRKVNFYAILFIRRAPMSIVNRENVLDLLYSYNPWWRTGFIQKEFVKPMHRFAYFEAFRCMMREDIRRSVVLCGARRTGKTTIMYQAISALLEQGVSPKDILFVSFDHPLLKLCSVNTVMETFRSNISASETVYCFFDEIQYAADWNNWLKILYDTDPKIKIMATGSASPILSDKTSESGLGRWKVIHVPTLSFYEYCELLQISVPPLPQDIKPTQLYLRDEREQQDILRKLSALQVHFIRYLQVGGFPELALSKDDLYAQRVLREDIVDKALKRDIPAIYGIRNIADIERIFLYLCYNSSNIINLQTMGKEMDGVSRTTIEKYISYLESASLIYVSPLVTLGAKKVLKNQNKIYIADAAMRNAVLMKDDITNDPEELGVIAETAVYKHIKAFYYEDAPTVGYYRGGGKGKEIDIVVKSEHFEPIMIEVKYREQAKIAEDDAIVMEAGVKHPNLVITKRPEDCGLHSYGEKSVYRIPAPAFLYLLGYVEQVRNGK